MKRRKILHTDAILYDMYAYIPSWELTYPLPAGTFKDDFPFPRVGYVRAYYFRLQIWPFLVSMSNFRGVCACFMNSKSQPTRSFRQKLPGIFFKSHFKWSRLEFVTVKMIASILPWVCICKDVKRLKQRWATGCQKCIKRQMLCTARCAWRKRLEFYLLGSPPKTSICSINMITNHNASTLFKWVVVTKLQSAYKPLTNFLDTWVESSLYPDIL